MAGEIGHAQRHSGFAPLEFSNAVGMPKRDALVLVHDILTGVDLRHPIRIIASGKILSAFHMVPDLAHGADACNSARGMLFARGCIQALRCNNNMCLARITTQNPALVKGLVVADKAPRVHSFHERTMAGLMKLLSAMGLSDPADLRPHHSYRRSNDLQAVSFAELYRFLEPGELLAGDARPAASTGAETSSLEDLNQVSNAQRLKAREAGSVIPKFSSRRSPISPNISSRPIAIRLPIIAIRTFWRLDAPAVSPMKIGMILAGRVSGSGRRPQSNRAAKQT